MLCIRLVYIASFVDPPLRPRLYTSIPSFGRHFILKTSNSNIIRYLKYRARVARLYYGLEGRLAQPVPIFAPNFYGRRVYSE